MMEKFWVNNVVTTIALVLLFLVLLYTVGVYQYANAYGHYAALLIMALLSMQLMVSIVFGIIRLKKHTVDSALLGIVSVVLSSVVLLYILDALFI